MFSKTESEIFSRNGAEYKSRDPQRDCRYTDGGYWSIFGENFESYLNDFRLVDGDGKLPDIINKIASKHKPVIVDLLAPTNTIADITYTIRGLRRIKGLAVGLGDTRCEDVRLLDKAFGIDYIPTDLKVFQNFNKISEWLGPDKADLIMERGYGALEIMPTNLRYQYRVINVIWKMLDTSGGLALLQLPPLRDLHENEIPVEEWASEVKRSGIYSQYLPSYESKEPRRSYGLLMLQKNSPEEKLPTLYR